MTTVLAFAVIPWCVCSLAGWLAFVLPLIAWAQVSQA